MLNSIKAIKEVNIVGEESEKNKYKYDLFKEKNSHFCNNFEIYIKNNSAECKKNLINILKKNDGKFNLNNISENYQFFNYLDYFLQPPNDSITNLSLRLRNFFDLYSQLNTKIEFSMANFKTISSKNHIFLLPILFYQDSISYESFYEYSEGQSYPLYMSNLLHDKHKQALNGWLGLMDLLYLPINDKDLKNKLFSLNKEDLLKTIYNISDISCFTLSTQQAQISALLSILDVNKNEDYVRENTSYYITIINLITQHLNRDNDYDFHELNLNNLHSIYPLNFVINDKHCSEYLEFLLHKYEKKYNSSYPIVQKFSEAKSNYEKGLLDNIIENNIPANKKNRI